MQLTVEQASSLAPNANTLKRAQKLAKPASFKNAGANERAVWAAVKGSGSDYQTFVDLEGIAYKCSCPVHNHPCKHALSLMLFAAAQSLPDHNLPDELQTWLNKRDAAKTRKENKTSEVKDPKAQAKRLKERENKVKQGIIELEHFLEDAVRMGLGELAKRKEDSWDKIQRRLIDAQAKGLATRIDWMRQQMRYQPHWTEAVFQALLELHLLISAYHHQDKLSPEFAADVREYVGWNRTKDQILSPDTQFENWLVLNQAIRYESGLYIQSIWLQHLTKHNIALVRNFAVPQSRESLSGGYLAGSVIEAKVDYYSTHFPLRALVERKSNFEQRNFTTKEWQNLEQNAFANLDTAIRYARDCQCKNPFLHEIPLIINNLRLVMKGDVVTFADSDNRLLALNRDFNQTWQLLSLMGVENACVFLIFDGKTAKPWALAQNGVWQAFDMNEGEDE
ncbi:MAG: hypothetical protein GQ569_09760 [Methylococcaceae bacterium]|nr:hypothetical protein [Methylococcaceae bacterium]